MSKPHFPDLCRHDRPRDRFLGTVECDGKKYDVHVYQDNALTAKPDFHVCLRYGHGSSQYISPGNVETFVRMLKERQWALRNPPVYEAALPLVEKFLIEFLTKTDSK